MRDDRSAANAHGHQGHEPSVLRKTWHIIRAMWVVFEQQSGCAGIRDPGQLRLRYRDIPPFADEYFFPVLSWLPLYRRFTSEEMALIRGKARVSWRTEWANQRMDLCRWSSPRPCYRVYFWRDGDSWVVDRAYAVNRILMTDEQRQLSAESLSWFFDVLFLQPGKPLPMPRSRKEAERLSNDDRSRIIDERPATRFERIMSGLDALKYAPVRAVIAQQQADMDAAIAAQKR